MSENPHNQVDDQEALGEFRFHFNLTIDTLREAAQRGEKMFYLNLLEEFENLQTTINAFEKGELDIEIEEELIPLKTINEMLDEEIPPTPMTVCCPSCESTDLKDVLVRPQNVVAKKCMHCEAVFEPIYFVGDIEVEDLE